MMVMVMVMVMMMIPPAQPKCDGVSGKGKLSFAQGCGEVVDRRRVSGLGLRREVRQQSQAQSHTEQRGAQAEIGHRVATGRARVELASSAQRLVMLQSSWLSSGIPPKDATGKRKDGQEGDQPKPNPQGAPPNLPS